MIPYFPQPTFSLGPYTAHAWGFMVFVGLMLGTNRAEYRIRRLGGDVETMGNLMFTTFIGAMLCSHVFELVVYRPSEFFADPFRLLIDLRSGYSSFGGFFSGAFIVWGYCRWKQISFTKYGESVVYGLFAGMIAGRFGCFLAHDHPGKGTNFFLGMRFPEEDVARAYPYITEYPPSEWGGFHDLGLYESLFITVLFLGWAISERKMNDTGYRPWLRSCTAVALYCVGRFGLDTLRVSDVRHSGLTPGQYSAMVLFAVGVAGAVAATRRQLVVPVATVAADGVLDAGDADETPDPDEAG